MTVKYETCDTQTVPQD